MKTNQLFLLTGLVAVTLPAWCPKGQKRGVGEAYEYSLYHVR